MAPYFLYNIAPLSMLLAVLITFGLLQRSNEITAMKATGISIYRIVVPVLVAAALIAAGLFFFDQFYLPYTNKRQDALRNQIKGKPAQTYLNPNRRWIFGEHSTFTTTSSSTPTAISSATCRYSVRSPTFQLTGASMPTAPIGTTACSAGSAPRDGSAVCMAPPFRATAPLTWKPLRLSEPPAYFKKEVKQSSEMNYEELRRYIHDLQQSGFDVVG